MQRFAYRFTLFMIVTGCSEGPGQVPAFEVPTVSREETAAAVMDTITVLADGTLAMDHTAAEGILGAEYEATATELAALNAAITEGIVTGFTPDSLEDYDLIDASTDTPRLGLEQGALFDAFFDKLFNHKCLRSCDPKYHLCCEKGFGMFCWQVASC